MCACMCMFVCMCACMHVCVCVHACAYVCMCMSACMGMCVRACVHACTCACGRMRKKDHEFEASSVYIVRLYQKNEWGGGGRVEDMGGEGREIANLEPCFLYTTSWLSVSNAFLFPRTPDLVPKLSLSTAWILMSYAGLAPVFSLLSLVSAWVPPTLTQWYSYLPCCVWDQSVISSLVEESWHPDEGTVSLILISTQSSTAECFFLQLRKHSCSEATFS